jgi:hypothetical protein
MIYTKSEICQESFFYLNIKNADLVKNAYLKGTRIICFSVCLMVLNATFSNISVISWLTGLLVEETGVPGENHRPAVSHSFNTLF